MRAIIVAICLGAVLGLAVPVTAQTAVRIFGITSTGTILPVLTTAAGYLVVWGS